MLAEDGLLENESPQSYVQLIILASHTDDREQCCIMTVVIIQFVSQYDSGYTTPPRILLSQHYN